MFVAVVEPACITVPLLGKRANPRELRSNSVYSQIISTALNDFAKFIVSQKLETDIEA